MGASEIFVVLHVRRPQEKTDDNSLVIRNLINYSSFSNERQRSANLAKL